MTSEHVVFLGWVPHCLHEGPVFKLALLHPLIMSQSTSESSKVRNLIHSYSLHTPATLWGTLSIANHMAATEHTYMKAKSKLPQQGRRKFEATLNSVVGVRQAAGLSVLPTAANCCGSAGFTLGKIRKCLVVVWRGQRSEWAGWRKATAKVCRRLSRWNPIAVLTSIHSVATRTSNVYLIKCQMSVYPVKRYIAFFTGMKTVSVQNLLATLFHLPFYLEFIYVLGMCFGFNLQPP